MRSPLHADTLRRRRTAGAAVLAVVALTAAAAMTSDARHAAIPVRVTVVYNNVAHAQGLATAWGFAAVIEAGEDVVLFDTGGDGATLLANMARLGIDGAAIDAIVLSHIHGDHTGGLAAVLAHWPDVTVYLPHSFPASVRRDVERTGARVETVSGARHLRGSFYSTGEMGDGVKEQALIVETDAGLLVITGCAHPGIVAMASAARTYREAELHLLMGGFHLQGQSTAEIRATVAALQRLGVHRVAPSHCTGDAAIELFRQSWGSEFVEGGCGAVIDVP